MKDAPTPILTVNAGSSGVKFALFAAAPLPEQVIGFTAELPGGHADAVGLEAAVDRAVDALRGAATPAAIGHRLVHGGELYSEPVLVDDGVLAGLRGLIPLDPEHLPLAIALLGELGRRYPGVPQVACFDTAFHRGLPGVATRLPIPRRFAEQGVRKYGFHGLSYAFLMRRLAELAGPAAAEGRVVLAHLGHGASMAAVRGGRPLDTTMGYTPAGGLPMGTRTGDLDPGVLCRLMEAGGLDAAGVRRLVNEESGLLGVSGTSSDLRALLAAEDHDPRAAEAVATFCYACRKQVGAYAAALGGLDTLVFAGGVGEHAAVVRTRTCEGLGFLGLHLDAAANAADAPVISTPGSRVAVRVIPTREAREIAGSTLRLTRPAAGHPC